MSDEICQTKQGWWVLKRDSHFSRWIEQAQRLDHDQPVLQILAPYIKPGGVVIDCGAALGDHTIFYLEKVGLAGMVYAFEPHPIQYECLVRNCPKAFCFNFALGDSLGQVSLFMEPLMVGSSRLIKEPGRWASHTVQVERIALDDVVPAKDISLIKIDVEGCEPEVIRGAEKIIYDCRPPIWMELNPEALSAQGHSAQEVKELLESLRYKVTRWYPEGAGWHGFEGGQCDMLCEPI